MAIGSVNTGGGTGTKSILIVTAPTGSTVTVTKGSAAKTATEKNGEWWFKGLENGEWTIRAELDGQSATEVFNITQFGVYRKPISYRMTPEFSYTGDYEIVQDDDTPIEDFASWKGNWKIRFLTSGDFNLTKMHGFSGKIDVFLVGGGGSGSATGWSDYDGCGGGGGGYTTTGKNLNVEEGKTYPIRIGSGGVGATVNSPGGKSGGETTGFEITAKGGQGGDNYDGGAGGSGGGTGEYESNTPAGDGGTDGGNGGVGNQVSGGAKGQGTSTREFGEPSGKLYAGGGGGCHYEGTGRSGKGGAGGGTDGARNSASAKANTGGGSGGSGLQGGSHEGVSSGDGGSGIVIIRNAREVAQ